MKKIKLAGWGIRLLAWLIDIIIVNALTGIMIISGQSAFWFDWTGMGIQSFILLGYWTLMEGYYGQSVGKMVFKLRVVNEEGKKIDYQKALIESLGKTFLLLIDVLIGVIAFNEKRQRVFNKLSNTIVIKDQPVKKGKKIEYVK